MKPESVIMFEAMGYISDDNLDSARSLNKYKGSWKLSRYVAIVAAAMLMTSVLAAFAYKIFSPIDGDDFAVSSSYLDGIITVTIENKSNRTIALEPQIKLFKFYANEEIKLSGEVVFSDTRVPAHNTADILIDISEAYDLSFLEQPLVDDYYYIVLTNNSFLFGYDWHCDVDFSHKGINLENIPNNEENPVEVIDLPDNSDTRILDGLKPYFESFVTEPYERNAKIEEYYIKCNELLGTIIDDGTNIIHASSPALVMGNPEDGVIFDERIDSEYQWQLISENSFMCDAYNIPLGSSDLDKYLTISARIPQNEGELNDRDCGSTIPVMYIAQYAKADIESKDDYVFVRGRLIKLRDFDDCKIFEDEEFVCYDITDFVYTNIDEHIDIVAADGLNGYIDDGVRERVKNICNYYRDRKIAEKLFYYIRQ